jgi:hypothetical protein
LKRAEKVEQARCSDVCGYLFFRVKEINIEEEGRLAACPARSELRMLASAGGLPARAAEVFFASRAKGGGTRPLRGLNLAGSTRVDG